MLLLILAIWHVVQKKLQLTLSPDLHSPQIGKASLESGHVSVVQHMLLPFLLSYVTLE